MKRVIFFLFIYHCSAALALVPLEGILFGSVEDTKQSDPLVSILNNNLTVNGKESAQKYYYGLFKQGSELLNYCEKGPELRYDNVWQRSIATRSIIGTLQYIGLDLSLKSIASYARKLEYSAEDYEKLYSNLIVNTCSKNLSVYSLKFLKQNFAYEWKKESVKNDSFEEKLFFSKTYQQRQNTKTVLAREFEYTLRNFRAFCSWGGDTSDYRMLVPYLKNPFIMSIVFNHMRKKKLALSSKTQELILSENSDAVRVGCEDLICRKRDDVTFNRMFPRMTGSVDLEDDLKALYCEDFIRARYKRINTNPMVLKWINEQTAVESKVAPLQFLATLTGIPDGLIVATTYKGLEEFFFENIKARWELWANKKLETYYNDQMYEEPLEIKLVEQSRKSKIENGDFEILFDVGLSELDKVLEEVDKVDTFFTLEMPIKYLTNIREQSEYLRRSAQLVKREKLINKIVSRLHHQMNKKKKLFRVPIWNDQISTLIADELLAQLNAYRGNKLSLLAKGTISIPVRFRFGVFALRYIREKHKFNQKRKASLTFR